MGRRWAFLLGRREKKEGGRKKRSKKRPVHLKKNMRYQCTVLVGFFERERVQPSPST